MRLVCGALILVLSLIPRTSAAQTAAGKPANARVVVDVNIVGLDGNAGSDRQFRSLTLVSAEVLTATASYPARPRLTGQILDLGGAYMFTPRVGIRVAAARLSSHEAAQFRAVVPDPIFWNTPSAVV